METNMLLCYQVIIAGSAHMERHKESVFSVTWYMLEFLYTLLGSGKHEMRILCMAFNR